MEHTNVEMKFEVEINGVVYEYDNINDAEKKMRSSYKTESQRNLFRKEIRDGEILQTYLLE